MQPLCTCPPATSFVQILTPRQIADLVAGKSVEIATDEITLVLEPRYQPDH